MSDFRRDAWDHAASLVTAALADDRVELADLFESMPIGTTAALLRITVCYLNVNAEHAGVPAADAWASFATALQSALDHGNGLPS